MQRGPNLPYDLLAGVVPCPGSWLLASGKTVSEVAGEMRLSVKTVSTYRSRVLAKMGLRSNEELATYAARNGLIP